MSNSLKILQGGYYLSKYLSKKEIMLPKRLPIT
jgi:hypothetical protein